MVKFCPECGAEVKKGYEFCGKCGFKFPEKTIHKEDKPVKKEIVEESKKEEVKAPVKPVEPPRHKKSKTKWAVSAIALVTILIIAFVVFSYYNPPSTDTYDSTSTGESADEGSTTPTYSDSDGDGYYDYEDDFPYDPSEWRDSDNDGYGDNSDAFPYDYTEHLDSDGDGMGDNADIDDDNDGYPDYEDYLPYEDAQIRIDLIEFIVKDEVDGWPDDSSKAQIYFEIYVNDEKIARSPHEGYVWEADIGITKTINWHSTFDVPDNSQTHMISIRMYDSDAIFNDQLDIDGNDDTKGCTITYDIVTETWTGDDTDGTTDGSYDGTQYSDDDDAYLKYDISNV